MRTRRVGPAGWRIYLNKAEEFHRAMADVSWGLLVAALIQIA